MRKNNFAILHILAAVMVIVGHQYILLGMQAPNILGINIHELGVKILFLISGYLVVGSYYRVANWKQYLKKRIERLYPELILCLIVTILVMDIVTTAQQTQYWHSACRYVIFNVIMRPRFALAGVFQNNVYPMAVNGSLWTLPVELVCYVILIPIVILYNKISSKHLRYAFWLAVLLSFSVFDIYRAFYPTEAFILWDTEWTNACSLILYFLLGMCFNVLNLQKYCNLQIAIVSIILWYCMPMSVRAFMLPYLLGYLIFSVALVENPVFYKIIKRDICYGLYLYAFPIQQLLINYFYDKINVEYRLEILLITTIVITCVVAEWTYALDNRIRTSLRSRH